MKEMTMLRPRHTVFAEYIDIQRRTQQNMPECSISLLSDSTMWDTAALRWQEICFLPSAQQATPVSFFTLQSHGPLGVRVCTFTPDS